MLTKQFIATCLVGLLSSGAGLPAGAQTGRIAHFSHGGSAATLASEEGGDNMGLPSTVYKKLKIVLLSDTTVMIKGWQRWDMEKAVWRPVKRTVQFRTYAKDTIRKGSDDYITTPAGELVMPLPAIQRMYWQTKLEGFDELVQKLSEKRKKKPAGRSQTFTKRPLQYSYWRALTGVAALGAVGWLLGKKRVA